MCLLWVACNPDSIKFTYNILPDPDPRPNTSSWAFTMIKGVKNISKLVLRRRIGIFLVFGELREDCNTRSERHGSTLSFRLFLFLYCKPYTLFEFTFLCTPKTKPGSNLSLGFLSNKNMEYEFDSFWSCETFSKIFITCNIIYICYTVICSMLFISFLSIQPPFLPTSLSFSVCFWELY